MQSKITGIITSIYQNDINTDDIIPAWTLQESTNRSFFKKYAFANYDPEFIKRCESKSNIIVAGDNFGCGSSREQAIYALKENNVIAVIAKSYPDIFYRNAINNGLVLIKVTDFSGFKLNKLLTIDLDKKIIISNKKNISFAMSQEDADTFNQGGKTRKIKNHLSKILQEKNLNRTAFFEPSRFKKGYNNNTKPQTVVEKIISDHVNQKVYAGERLEQIPIDMLFFNEVIGPAAIKDYINNFTDIYNKQNKPVRVFDPKKVFFVPDHTVPSCSVAVSEGITLMEEFAKKQEIFCYKEGAGIGHVVLAEDGHILPGKIILGTDSHTDTNGAFNALAFGIGTTDGAYALATGNLYDFEVPATIRINFKNKLNKGVFAKDIVLHLLSQLGVDGASKKILEFGGPGLKNISIEGRATIANMAVEMGARSGIFELDGRKGYLPDPKCAYDQIVEVNLSTIEPLVAFPHKPDNVKIISTIKDSPKITDAFIGSCTNGRYEDFVEAGKILKSRKVHEDVNLVVIPASRKIYIRLLKAGVIDIFAKAGANIESANCGPCFGKHMGILGRGANMISTSNRNYIGRMGSKDANIFLASPSTVAASAIAGKIVDPRIYL